MNAERGLDMTEHTPSRHPETMRTRGTSTLLEGADPTVLVIAAGAVVLVALAVVWYTGGSLTVVHNGVSVSLNASH